ncbi:Ig-like domain-containing protein [Paenibacillus dokdonensis]|uniref:Ig-like domain-containing protein n=1 Tax=Paenibacillus dokdonensis TaxID=2567944 RepID=A0ABU6GKC8_9BACL|nr:Ig-like domain-containing protein [Paenibacillus dokdonensis]MEC0240189.1 Ig-like domain-containing protein [Paenibacillus dokdonensis]
MAAKRGYVRLRIRQDHAVRKLGICLVLFVFLALSCIPPSSVSAAAQITIDSPGTGGPLSPGITRLTGTYSGVYDIEIAMNGNSLTSAHMKDGDAGRWYADVDLSMVDGSVEIVARGKDALTRYVTWSPYLQIEVDNPQANIPQVRVISPAEQDPIQGQIPVEVEASGKNGIDLVQVRINGGEWENANPGETGYSLQWDTKSVSGRINSLEARAEDVNGNIGYSQTVYVKAGITVDRVNHIDDVPGMDAEYQAEESVSLDGKGTVTEEEAAQAVSRDANRQDRALWIWENESYPLIMNSGARTVLNAMSSDTDTFGQDQIRTWYLAVGNYNGVQMLEDKRAEVRDFIGWAHDRGYQVQALIAGGTTPPYFGAYSRYRTQAVAEFERILNYNLSSGEQERFDGVNIDTEPYSLPEFKSDKPSVQVQYLDMLKALMDRKAASGLSLQVGAAIPRWFDTSGDATDILWNGSVKPLSEHVQDTLDYISIMDYRDQAEGTAGIIEQARGEMEYANQIGKPYSVVLGVETKDIADGGDPETISFHEEGRLYMEAELDKVYAAFDGNPAFGGIAIHHYDSLRNLPSVWGPEAVFWQAPTDNEPPTAVSGGLRATVFDYQQIDISYGPAADNAAVQEYRIYRGTSMGFSLDEAHLAGVSKGLGFRDNGLLPDTKYIYKVTAVDTSGNEGPPSSPVKARTEDTLLKPMIVSQMQVKFDGTKATVTLQISDMKTGGAIAAANISGRFTFMAGKYVSGTATAAGAFSAGSETVSSPSGEIGFAPRQITAPGYYWAQAYDMKEGSSVRWGG